MPAVNAIGRGLLSVYHGDIDVRVMKSAIIISVGLGSFVAVLPCRFCDDKFGKNSVNYPR